MAFYETMRERVASILAELDVRAEPALEVVAVCARQIRFGLTAFVTAVYAGNLTLVGGLVFKFKFRLCGSTFKFHHISAAD